MVLKILLLIIVVAILGISFAPQAALIIIIGIPVAVLVGLLT